MQMLSLSGQQDGFGRCSECAKSDYDADRNQTFQNKDSLWAHIATTHIYWHPFECVLCPMVFLPTEGVLKQHYERTHPKKVPKAIYTYVEEKKAEIGCIFLESQRFLDGNKVHNIDVNSNAAAISTIKDNKVAADQQNGSHQQKQEIIVSDTEDEEEITMGIEQEERLNMNRLTKKGKTSDIFIQLQTIGNTSAVVFEDDQAMTVDQAQSNKYKEEEEESKEEISEIEKDKDNVSFINHRKLVKQSSMKAKRVFPCNLCKDKTTTVTQQFKGRHLWSHHMGNHQRFRCKSCDYKTSVTSKMIDHSRHKHKRLSGTNWTDHTTELKTEYHRRYVAAFGAIKQGQTIKPLAQIQHATERIHHSDCNLCNRSVPKAHRVEHIWRFHMKAKRYACLHCDYGSGRLKYIKHHATKKHGNTDDKPCWKDNMQSMSEEYMKIFDAAFEIVKVLGKNNL